MDCFAVNVLPFVLAVNAVSFCILPLFRPDDWCPHTSRVPQHRDWHHDRAAFHIRGALELHWPSPGPDLQRAAVSRPVQKWGHLILRTERPLWHAPHHCRSCDISNERQLFSFSNVASLCLHAPLLSVQNHHARRPDALQLWRRERLYCCGTGEGVSPLFCSPKNSFACFHKGDCEKRALTFLKFFLFCFNDDNNTF